MESDLRCAWVAAAGVILALLFFSSSLWWESVPKGILLKRAREVLRNLAFLLVSGGAFSFLILAKNFSEAIILFFWVTTIVIAGLFLFTLIEL